MTSLACRASILKFWYIFFREFNITMREDLFGYINSMWIAWTTVSKGQIVRKREKSEYLKLWTYGEVVSEAPIHTLGTELLNQIE